jgi:hypothetical protein
VAIARGIYDTILASENPKRFIQRDLPVTGPQISAITNRWLAFQNIKDAALKQDFSLVQIAYNRNEALLAAKAATDPDKTAFVEWAVEYIRSKSTSRDKITQARLFVAWSADGVQRRNPKSFFIATRGTPLTMKDLNMLAFPHGRQRRPAGGDLGDLGDSDTEGGTHDGEPCDSESEDHGGGGPSAPPAPPPPRTPAARPAAVPPCSSDGARDGALPAAARGGSAQVPTGLMMD